MPKVTEEHRASQRARIRAAAMEVVRTKGLAAMTMTDIIAASGLSAGAIYGYYSGKEELVRDVAMTVVDSKGEHIDALAQQRPVPPPSRLVEVMVHNLPQDWVRGGLLLQFWGASASEPHLVDHSRDFASHLMRRIEHYLAAWLTQCGEDPARAAGLAPVLSGIVQGYVLQVSLGVTTDADAYLANVDAVLQGTLAHR